MSGAAERDTGRVATWAADFHYCCAVLEAEIPAPPAKRASATLPQGIRARSQALAAIRKALATGTLPRLGEVFDLHLHALDHAVEQGLLHLQHGILPAETVSALQDLLQTRLRRSVAGETGRLNPRVLSRLPFDAALTPFITEEVLQVEAARVLFVLDASSSMHTRHTEATLKTKAESVADCLVTLGQLFERLQQEDYDMNWAVISFAGDVQVLRAFTARRMPEEVARQYLAWRQPATRLWGGLAAAHRLLDQEAPQTRQLVIVLTDAELDGKDMQQLHTGLRPEVQYLFLRVGTRLQRFAEPRLQALYDRLFQHGLHAVDDLSPALVKAMEAMMSWH